MKNMEKHPRNKSEQGQAIVIIVFSLIAVFAVVGLAMDGSQAFSDRRQAQNAADSAALAAALAYLNKQELKDAAFYRANTNGYPNDGVRSTVVVEHPPADGPYGCAMRPTDCNDYIRVSITSHVKTWFGSVVGVQTVTNNVSAVAKAKKKISEPFYNGAALVALDPATCRSFYFTGSATTTVTGSGIFVNSSCNSANITNPQQAFYSSGNGRMQVPWIKVVGGAYYRPGDLTLEQPIATHVVPYGDIRDIYNLPDINCSAAGGISGSDSTVAIPGAYTSFPPDGVTQMEPGKYCVGDLKIKDNLVGEGVLIVTLGAVKINEHAYVSLKAKTQGPYAGLLIYMPPAHAQPVVIEGNSGLELTGTIVAPSSDITISGTGNAAMGRFNSQIIGKTITISGNSAMQINYKEEDNYHPTTPPKVEIVR